nr:hypothetical protein KK1_007812 [Ipomoea batatas]
MVSEGVTEMAAVAVSARVAVEDHAANLSLVAWMAELLQAVCKLAVVSIWACACFLPFVAKLSLEHPLVVHFQFKPTSTGLSCLQVATGADRDTLGKQNPAHVISLDPTRVHHASWALVTVSKRRRRTHVLPQLSLACRFVVSNWDALPPHSEFRRGTELSSVIRRRLEQQGKAVVQIEVRHLEIDVLLPERLGLFRRLAEVSEDGIMAVHQVPVVLLVQQELRVRNA